MIWLLVPYLIVGLVFTYLLWGLGTMDTDFLDVSAYDVVFFVMAGLLWPITLTWYAWEFKK